MPSDSANAARQLTSLQLAGVGLAGLALALVFGTAVFRSPSAPFLLRDPAAPWIAADSPVHSDIVSWPTGRDPESAFGRDLPAGTQPAPTRIAVRALRSFVLEVDGQELARSDGRAWKTWTQVEVPGAPAGARLTIRVRNPVGPALLQVRSRSPGGVDLSSASDWRVSTGGSDAGPAVVADDTRRNPRALVVPRAADSWQSRATLLAGFVVLFAIAAAWLQHPDGRDLQRPLVRGAPFLLAAVWLGLFVKALGLPAYMGFDGPDHLEYVRFVQQQGALPLATDGAMMYHPPLFYAASAALLALVGPLLGPDWEVAAVRVVPFAAGVALTLLAGALARVVYAGDRLRTMLALAFVALLPMNLYMASYLSNEGLHAALAACAIWLVARQLASPETDRREVAIAGVVLGLAVLAKVTSLVYVPIVVVFLALKGRVIDRAGWSSILASVALFLAGCVLVCGWFFARNQLLLGQALVGNWNVPGGDFTWWQHPGFHTLGYYTQFGDAVTRPFFSGFHSFFDGMYSTFWGDGLIGGIADWRNRHSAWSYEFMAIVYGLALPASALGVVGFGRTVVAAFSGVELPRRMVQSFLVATVSATAAVLLLLNWVHPAYGMNKSFYALAVAGPIALFGVEGFLWADGWYARRGSWARVLYHSWACTLAVVIVLAFLA